MPRPYKTKFEDFVSIRAAEKAYAFGGTDGVSDLLWAHVRDRYPKYSLPLLDEIYRTAKNDFLRNYDVDVKVTITRQHKAP